MSRRIMQFVVLLTLGLVALAGPAAAEAGYPPSGQGPGVTPSAGPPGTTVTVTGTCDANATLTVSVGQTAVGSVTSGPTGSFSADIVIPATATLGDDPVTVTGPGCAEHAEFTVQPPATEAFAFTGARHVFGLAGLAAGLAILGAILVFAARRRSESSPRAGV